MPSPRTATLPIKQCTRSTRSPWTCAPSASATTWPLRGALLTGQAAQEYDPGRVPCFAIVLSVRDRSLCLRASEAEAQATGHLDAADVNGNGAPI